MEGLISSFTELVKVQVTGCWYRQTHVRVAIIAAVRIPAPFLGGGGRGGRKSSFFSLFRNTKASFKGIDMLNCVHI